MLERLKCVLIDDDPDWIALVHHSLEKWSMLLQPIKFFDGRTALEFLRRAPVDFVVTDMSMPGFDGLAFIERFRRFDQSTPVIMVSSDESVAPKALARGANAFVPKGALNTRLAPTVTELVAARMVD